MSSANQHGPTLPQPSVTTPEPLLKVPLFPGARHEPLARRGVTEALSDVAVAALTGQANRLRLRGSDELTIDEFRNRAVDGWRYFDPFTGEAIGVAKAIELCGFWQSLIEANQDISATAGIAFWKRETVAPLLWGGRQPRSISKAEAVDAREVVAVWKAKVSRDLLRGLEGRGAELIEVEDGFIRSSGLGADCVPPLSIVVDRSGVHFDPSRPSDLEEILERRTFSPEMIERAQRLRTLIVASGLSKYSTGGLPLARQGGERPHILVPGQVEDDRSIVEGGGAVRTNLDLLHRVRKAAPGAHIIYKPHPDIEAGHRVGAMPDATCLEVADEIVRGVPISSAIAIADAIHVNTSLAGFEALLRDKAVTTHGVPFYAGWGLTTDLGQVPARRRRKLSLDELVAGVLLEYPRYLDPVTGLPCPAEVVVRRLTSGKAADPNLIVAFRRVQGKIMRRLRSLVQ